MRFPITTSFIFVFLLLLSCEKEEAKPYVHQPYVAPCSPVEKVLELDSILYGPSQLFPQATLRITFSDTTLEFGFNKVPETGIYQIVSPMMLGDNFFENQIAFANDAGSFKMCSTYSDSAVIYVDNYDNQLTISHCELPNGGNYYFDPILNIYSGNPDGKRLFCTSY